MIRFKFWLCVHQQIALTYLNHLLRYPKQQKHLSKYLSNVRLDRGGSNSKFCETPLSSDSSIVISWMLNVSVSSWLWCLEPFNFTGKKDISSGSSLWFWLLLINFIKFIHFFKNYYQRVFTYRQIRKQPGVHSQHFLVFSVGLLVSMLMYVSSLQFLPAADYNNNFFWHVRLSTLISFEAYDKCSAHLHLPKTWDSVALGRKRFHLIYL